MQFTNQVERDAYLSRVRRYGAEPGSAKEHATTFNLGIWGDRESLLRDCAEIYAGEIVRHFKSRQRVPLPSQLDLKEVIANCGAFRDAFRRWQIPVNHKFETMMAGVVECQKVPPPLRQRDYEVDDDKLMRDVINELHRTKDAWQHVAQFV